jgi:hypothetical protein
MGGASSVDFHWAKSTHHPGRAYCSNHKVETEVPMSDSAADRDSVPAPPSLVAPRDASVANGAEVTFVWEPVDAAVSYRLQVAPTARFDELLLDKDVGTETAVRVGNTFSTDGDTLFWRVRAVSESGWSDGGAIESFVAATPEKAAQAVAHEADEQPVTGLARAERREQPRQVFTLDDQFEEEKERGVAYEGVAASQIMAVAGAILVVILVAVVIIFGWYEQVSQEARATVAGEEMYTRVQEVDREAAQQLQEYGVVDEENDVYHIPIDQAMDRVLTERYGQASEASGAAEPQEGQQQDEQ